MKVIKTKQKIITQISYYFYNCKIQFCNILFIKQINKIFQYNCNILTHSQKNMKKLNY